MQSSSSAAAASSSSSSLSSSLPSSTSATCVAPSIGAPSIKKTPVTTTNNNKFIQPSKPSSMKTNKHSTTTSISNIPHTSTATLLSNGTASRDLQTSREIEEISKKISEHADALYRTWKSHGIAPTEILELYTAEAAAATGSITEDVKSTEGLQKLVNSFVIKDKEQRGVKTSAKASGTMKSGTKQQQANLKSPSQTLDNRPELHNSIKKSTTSPGNASSSKMSTPAFLINSNKTSRLGGIDITEVDSVASNKPALSTTPKLSKTKGSLNTSSKQSSFNKTSITNPSSTNSMPLKSMDFNLNLDINLDLNLDVQALTLQQSENLLKIKELLKQEPSSSSSVASVRVAASATKIPSVIVEKSATKSNPTSSLNTNTISEKSSTKSKESKVNKKSSGENLKKPSVIVLEENKQNEELKVQKKLATAIDSHETTPLQIKKIGNKLKSTSNEEKRSAATNSLDRPDNHRGQVEVEAINQTLQVIDNKLNKSDKDRDRDSSNTTIATTTATGKKRATTSAGPTSPSASVKSSSSGGSGSSTTTSSNILLNGTADIRSLENINASETLVPQFVEPLEEVLKKSVTKSAKTSKSTKEKSKDNAAQKTELSAKASAKLRDPLDPAATPTPTPTPSVVEVTRSSSSGTMLTPSKLKSARPLSNGQDKNSRSPFLTRGSVAERVLMFEKCPDARNSFLNIKRPDPADAPPKSLLKAKLHATPPPPAEHNSLQREIRNTKSVYIPRFYFPHGKPQPTIALERTLRTILSAFDKFPNNQVTRAELPQILKICGIPFYWRMPVMVFCQQGNSGLVERQRFVEFWKQMNVYCHDEASRFVYILARGQRLRTYILPEDLAPLVQDVVDTHPGLAFLKEATEFHSRYVHTVIARIFYNVNRCWSGRIAISELKKSDLLEIISLLEEEDDINQIMAFFSYEHFYVIYCKFWELDKDHDLLISQDDLARHSDHALSTRIVERIFSGCVTRNDNKKNPDDEPKMSYTDFVWFLLSEEDKRTPTAIEYWFRCMDVDGDGVLSMYELEYFYEEQQQRMESIGIESLPFEDCLCQMLDMIKPKRRDAITLSDLKNCKMTHVFFDTFFNLEKYLDHEQRDPFASQRDEYTSDWDRFAAQEYELLITEEND